MVWFFLDFGGGAAVGAEFRAGAGLPRRAMAVAERKVK